LAQDLARILIYGDIHLSSKNYGAHKDYPKESLYYFKLITDKTEELRATHLIGLGDFSYGRFHNLEYRLEVEKLLNKQYELVNGNRYELLGNHDTATYGMTEYQYYIKKGLLKPSTNFTIGDVNISMVNNNEYNSHQIIEPSDDKINIVLMHNFFRFRDTDMPDFGNYINLDDFINWFGVDYIIGGHIHSKTMFNGVMVKDGVQHKVLVNYPGCLSRPVYRESTLDTIGSLVLLTIRDNGEMQYDILDIPLWDISESFNLVELEEQKKEKLEKGKTVDISDIIQQLNTHQRTVGNIEDIIEALVGIESKYKKKAIDLLKIGQA